MKTENLEKILGSIDKKTIDSVLKERGKRTEEAAIKSKPAANGPVRYTEGKSSLGARILKIVSVAAAVAVIAALAYVCYLPIYMQAHGAQTEAAVRSVPEHEWTAIYYTDASLVYAGMTAEAAKAALPDGTYSEGILYKGRDTLYINDQKTDHVFFAVIENGSIAEVRDSGVPVNHVPSADDFAKLRGGMTLDEAVELLGRPYRTEYHFSEAYPFMSCVAVTFRYFEEHTFINFTLINASQLGDDPDKYIFQEDPVAQPQLIDDLCDPFRTDNASIEDAQSIAEGMTFGQILSILGRPAYGSVASGSTLHSAWKLKSGATILVHYKYAKNENHDPFERFVCNQVNIFIPDFYFGNGAASDPASDYFNRFKYEELLNTDKTAKVSRYDAESIKNGMSYEQVVGILGKPVRCCSVSAHMMEWNMENTVFENDRVIRIAFSHRGTGVPVASCIYVTETDTHKTVEAIKLLKQLTVPDRPDKISLEDAGKIKKGMTLKEIIGLIGEPQSVENSTYCLVWEIADSDKVLKVYFTYQNSDTVYDITAYGILCYDPYTIS